MYPESHIEITCFKRASTPGQSVNSTINTVREYQTQGLIQGVTFEAWPERISLTRTLEGGAVVEQYDRFLEWAETHGVSLEPAFDRRELTTLVSDTTERVLVLPVLCFGIYIDETLASVVPHQTRTDTYTTADALTDIKQYGRPRVSMLATEDVSTAD